MKTLTSINENCIGCRLCEIACAVKHFEVGNPKKSAVKVYQKFPEPGINEPVFCRQCTFPPCIGSCKSKALSRGRDGIIQIDISRCDNCGSCAKGCPFGAIFGHKEIGHPLICNLCGGHPECAKICPTQAIRYVPAGSVGDVRRIWIVERQDIIRRI